MTYAQHSTRMNGQELARAANFARADCAAFQRACATLIVIDMQFGFEASRNPQTIAAVAREIRINVSRRWPIVIVECRPETFGSTYPELLNEVQDCPQDFIGSAYKEHNNGSQQVLDVCRKKHFDTELLRVCGVNTTQCVEETVLGLSSCLPYSCIEVVKDACNDWHENNFGRMLRCANVVLRDGDELQAS